MNIKYRFSFFVKSFFRISGHVFYLDGTLTHFLFASFLNTVLVHFISLDLFRLWTLDLIMSFIIKPFENLANWVSNTLDYKKRVYEFDQGKFENANLLGEKVCAIE